jgi:hypothetical protein
LREREREGEEVNSFSRALIKRIALKWEKTHHAFEAANECSPE